MKKWLLFIPLVLFPLALAHGEPFLSVQGTIMNRDEIRSFLVVNETRFFIEPSTEITDEKGNALEFDDLKLGHWVRVDAEPDDVVGMVARRIVLIGNP